MNPVIISAARFELEPLVNGLQQRGHTPDMLLTGVGAIAAAKKSRVIAEQCRGRDVIFVGTCGSFSSFSKVYLVRAQEVCWSPTCERLKLAYTIKDSMPPLSLPDPPPYLISLPPKKVLCTPGISLVGALPEGFSTENTVENLELYSCIAEIATQAQSLAVILAVTNLVGPESHLQWKQNFPIAAGMTAEYVIQKVDGFSREKSKKSPSS